ncbi:MAG: Smr/MutS family protein [Desulfobacteraceae bacterium]|nr:Smr/MutS family protein [Desulfobacteraceae bacterium]
MKKRNKQGLPIFHSDEDFIKAFEKKSLDANDVKQRTGPGVKNTANRPEKETEPEEDFQALLEESFQRSRTKPLKKPVPIPPEKRIKRYPPPEKSLDLHGYNAIGAEVRSRSFIHSCKQQGFFTIRIIVGRGRHSDQGAVLPDVVEDVAKEMKKQGLVIGFDWENKIKSKSGALIVYLKQFERFDG